MLKEGIIRKKADFDRLYKGGKSAGDRYVVVFGRPNGLEKTRIAFLASKKVGNSVARNRARRLMKESYRLSGEIIPEGTDILFIARNTITDAKQGEVQQSMIKALKKAGILKEINQK